MWLFRVSEEIQRGSKAFQWVPGVSAGFRGIHEKFLGISEGVLDKL